LFYKRCENFRDLLLFVRDKLNQMENNNNTYIHLQSLLEAGHHIPAPKHNVIGWKIRTEAGTYVGETIDLLYDTQARTVRYLVIEVNNNGSQLEGKQTIIPVGIATLHPELDEIILPNLHADQLALLPVYIDGAVNGETERRVREVIGSPAALRMEETMIELDQQAFYAHHHFDSERFFSRENNSQSNASSPRDEENQTIHELIENSKAHDLHAANKETGKDTHHNEQHQIKPQVDTDGDRSQQTEI
jgi:hypothetical protein